jgi:oligopeptide/dipeptide ABC transporter ATP-binding protein
VSAEPLLKVSRLTVEIATASGGMPVVDDVSFALDRGETLGIVGESGSGKSMIALSLVRLLPAVARVTRGEISLDGTRIDGIDERALRKLRGRVMALMFQDASSSLNPVFTVGQQLTDVLRHVKGLSRADAGRRAVELLEMVEIRRARDRMHEYPFELSGGMRQRVLLAMSLACEADLLIADEPTSALDTVIQAQIAKLMLRLQQELRFGLLFISHDMRLVGDVADRVMVLYASRMAEYGAADTVLGNPIHPYTDALLRCVPGDQARSTALPTLPGQLPALGERDAACLFRHRCPKAQAECGEFAPPLAVDGGAEHWGRCFHPIRGAVERA